MCPDEAEHTHIAFVDKNKAWSYLEQEMEMLDCERQGFANLILRLVLNLVLGQSDSIETLIPPSVIFNCV